MSKHTPEPWTSEIGATDPLGSIVDACDQAVCACQQRARDYNHSERNANRDRIVACVNACKGINPEAVPGLLAACKGVMLGITEVSPGFFTIGGNAVGILRAAIALAEGGQA